MKTKFFRRFIATALVAPIFLTTWFYWPDIFPILCAYGFACGAIRTGEIEDGIS